MIKEGLNRFLSGSGKNVQRDSFIWNTIAGGINAAEAIVFMMIITRTNGVEAAGFLSIAFAVGNLLMTVGKYGVRNYQVTDVRKEYSFNDYLTLRYITVGIMALCSGGFVCVKICFSDYVIEKGIVVLAVCLIYVIESFEDVFLGYYQEEGRLDIASKVFILRWLVIMAVFSLGAILKKDLVFAVVLSVLFSLLAEIVLLRLTVKMFRLPEIRLESKGLKRLIKQCFFLFAAAFLTYYVTNAPKYAIDGHLTEDIQAYYGYISMPVFVVELLNCFLYQPQMVDLANDWNKNNLSSFRKRELRQFGMIAGLTIVCAAGAWLCGIPVLSAIYGLDLGEFKPELLILMTAGGALAFVGYTSVLLTIMRRQQQLLINMLLVTIMAVAGFGRVVSTWNMTGAAVYYLILMSILAVLNYCCVLRGERGRKNAQSGEGDKIK